jgi:hypothetical protein
LCVIIKKATKGTAESESFSVKELERKQTEVKEDNQDGGKYKIIGAKIYEE